MVRHTRPQARRHSTTRGSLDASILPLGDGPRTRTGRNSRDPSTPEAFFQWNPDLFPALYTLGSGAGSRQAERDFRVASSDVSSVLAVRTRTTRSRRSGNES